MHCRLLLRQQNKCDKMKFLNKCNNVCIRNKTNCKTNKWLNQISRTTYYYIFSPILFSLYFTLSYIVISYILLYFIQLQNPYNPFDHVSRNNYYTIFHFRLIHLIFGTTYYEITNLKNVFNGTIIEYCYLQNGTYTYRLYCIENTT